jgi:polar amino acid transport system substrate-binding protein
VTARRRIFLAAAATLVMLLAAVAAGCGSTKEASTGTGGTTVRLELQQVRPPAGQRRRPDDRHRQPRFPPWFGGTPHKPWQVSDPRSGEGYESAVAYAVARKLGFAKSEVKWIHVPFNNSFAPGPKSFDFDINQISFDKKRAEVVDFSDSYYDVNQSIVVNKGTPIASARSIADLKPYSLGAQLGTTSYQFIKDTIKPSKQPSVFPSNAGRRAGSQEQADRRARRRPADRLLRHAVQVPNGKVLGQFPHEARRRALRMVFAKGNSLRACVNKALDEAP